MKAEAILRRLIAARSDSGTAMELAMADALVQCISADPYFAARPEQFGAWDIGDALKRPVVWALKKGTGRHTLVLTGHYDAVGIANYGPLAPLACDPNGLAAALRQSDALDGEARRDLESGQWLFGRAGADMKAGLALNLEALFEHAPGALNILFAAVPDEENLSAGARGAAGLFRHLAGRYGLEYVFGVISESNPRLPERGDPLPFYSGSCGKVMPVVVARGHLAHAARSMNGLNSATLISRIADAVELNPALISRDKGMGTHPPAVQILRDMKVLYDVSTPQYSAVAFNLTYLQSRAPLDLLEQIRGLCAEALGQAVEKYRAVYTGLAAEGVLAADAMLEFAPAAYLASEVEQMAAQKAGYAGFRRALKEKLEQAVAEGTETLQLATMKYLQALMDFAGLPAATAVVAIAPPFYPAANSDYLGDYTGELAARLTGALAGQGIQARAMPYSEGITDMSYLACTDPAGAEKVMENIALRGPLYDVDFKAIAQNGFPSMLIGPAGKTIHQAMERVYLPDVNENIPAVYRQLIELLEQDAGQAEGSGTPNG